MLAPAGVAVWATRFLLKARQKQAALRSGQMKVLEIDNPAVLAFWRIADGGNGQERLLCVYNLSNQQQSIALDLNQEAGHSLVDLMANDQRIIVTEWPVVINLGAHSSHWYRLEA